MNEFDQDPFIARAKAVLDEKSNDLDAETQRRLRQARLAALARISSSGNERQGSRWLPLIPAGAMAAGLLALVFYMDRLQPPLPSIYQDPEQLAAAESMELLDNLEFAAWLVLQEGN